MFRKAYRLEDIGSVFAVAFDVSIECQHPVIVFLRHRINFVIMAAAAVDGQAQKRLACGRQHIVKLIEIMLVGVGGFIIEQAEPIKTRSDHRLRSYLIEFVSGDLFADELIVGHIFVEGSHDVIAIAPDERFGRIALVTVCFGVADHIHPVPRPAFSELGRGEQSVDQLLVGIGCGIVDKRFDGIFRWR